MVVCYKTFKRFIYNENSYRMPLPTDTEAKLLRQLVLAGMADQVARKVLPNEIKEDQNKAKWKHAYRYAIDYLFISLIGF